MPECDVFRCSHPAEYNVPANVFSGDYTCQPYRFTIGLCRTGPPLYGPVRVTGRAFNRIRFRFRARFCEEHARLAGWIIEQLTLEQETPSA